MKTMKNPVAVAMVFALSVAFSAAASAQQKFQAKPIRMLVPFSAGSQTDILARWMDEKMSENWGQQVAVSFACTVSDSVRMIAVHLI